MIECHPREGGDPVCNSGRARAAANVPAYAGMTTNQIRSRVACRRVAVCQRGSVSRSVHNGMTRFYGLIE